MIEKEREKELVQRGTIWLQLYMTFRQNIRERTLIGTFDELRN